MEDIDDLCQQGDPGIYRNILSAGTGRLSTAILVLVEKLDAVGNVLRKPHLSSNVRAAVAARINQLPRNFTAVLKDVQNGAKSFGQSGLETRMGKHEAKSLRQAPVDVLEVLLEREIVSQIKLANSRGIAAASKILEQERIVEVGQFVFTQSDVLADIDANPATPHAMSCGLALCQIECMAQGTEQFCKANTLRHVRSHVHVGH
jgi:hypothetical protein